MDGGNVMLTNESDETFSVTDKILNVGIFGKIEVHFNNTVTKIPITLEMTERKSKFCAVLESPVSGVDLGF